MSRDTIDNDWEFDEIDPGVEDDDDLLDECGLTSGGQCMLAGTEHCDFSCPMRDSEFFAGSEAWRRKHKRASRARSQP